MENKTFSFGAGIEAIIPEDKLKQGTKLYMAGPLGFAESSKSFHAKVMEVVKLMGGEILDPWVLTDATKIQRVLKIPLSVDAKKAWEELNDEIGANNMHAIEQATGIIAVLDGVDVDSGTATEIGYAYSRGIPILGYRGDTRLSRDNLGGNVNLQVEYFINHSGGSRGKVITKISELPSELLKIWG